MIRSDLSNYSDAYIVAKRKKNVKAAANIDIDQKDTELKNNAPLGHS